MPVALDQRKPRLSVGARLKFDAVRGIEMVLLPETVITLSETAASIIKMCDGKHDLGQIVAALQEEFDAQSGDDIRSDVEELLAAMTDNGVLERDSCGV